VSVVPDGPELSTGAYARWSQERVRLRVHTQDDGLVAAVSESADGRFLGTSLDGMSRP
jgi:hypothetical protein